MRRIHVVEFILQDCVVELFILEISVCFDHSEELTERRISSLESPGLSLLKAEFDKIKHHFLQIYPLTQIKHYITKNQSSSDTGSIVRDSKILNLNVFLEAPYPVFDLSNFMQQRAAKWIDS